jgi:cytochrome c556
MNRIAVLAALGLLVLGTEAVAARPSVKVEMKRVVEPASNTVFNIGGQVDPANGPDAKATAAEWKSAETAARKLAAVAAGLSQKGRAKAGKEWPGFVKDMADLSARAAKAAAAHDGAGLSKAANDLSDNCSACHAKYKPQTGD